MQPGIKIVVAILVVALIAVIGLIVLTKGTGDGAGEPAAEVTMETQAGSPAEKTKSETQIETPEPTADPQAEQMEAADKAQTDDSQAQESMYEGALAGLSEEEIGQLAIQEEGSDARTNSEGDENAVD